MDVVNLVPSIFTLFLVLLLERIVLLADKIQIFFFLHISLKISFAQLILFILLSLVYSGIKRDNIMANTSPNDDTQNYPFFRIQLAVKMSRLTT